MLRGLHGTQDPFSKTILMKGENWRVKHQGAREANDATSRAIVRGLSCWLVEPAVPSLKQSPVYLGRLLSLRILDLRFVDIP
jgi:hypothetical protein